MYLYDSPASFSRSQNLSLAGTFSRFGDPPAPSPDLILDDFDFDRADLSSPTKTRSTSSPSRLSTVGSPPPPGQRSAYAPWATPTRSDPLNTTWT